MNTTLSNLTADILDRLFEIEQENARLKKAMITDKLTRLLNRHGYENKLQELWEEAISQSKNISIAVLDIDNFKSINDSLGHDVGDRRICELAGLLQTHTRRFDIPCRFGGDEFCVILPNTPAMSAFKGLDRIRMLCAGIGITISVGIAARVPVDGDDPNTLFKVADNNLYKAKQLGKNRVIY